MSSTLNKGQPSQAEILDFVIGERSKALSRREWKHRLAGFGYNIRETETGDVVETLMDRKEICVLPALMSA